MVPINIRTETVIEQVEHEYAESYAYLETSGFVYIVPADALTDDDGEIYFDEITPSRAYDYAVLVIRKMDKEVVKSRFF